MVLVLCFLICTGVASGEMKPEAGLDPSVAESQAKSSDAEGVMPEAIAVKFIEDLAADKSEELIGVCDEAMTKAVRNGGFKGLWAKVTPLCGSLLGVSAEKAGSKDGYDVFVVTAELEFGRLPCIVSVKNGRVGGLFFKPMVAKTTQPPPDYVDQSSFTETEVTVDAACGPLPAILTKPIEKPSETGTGSVSEGERQSGSAASGFPIMVLVHGSGAHDKDETVGPNKPFRDLAWGLATLGIATLRYDKGNFVHPPKGDAVLRFTVNEEVVLDAVKALEMARNCNGIDPNRVYMLGHSLGGYAGPRILAAAPFVRGGVLMAATARSLAVVVSDQIRYLAWWDGSVGPEEEKAIADTDMKARRVKLLYEALRAGEELNFTPAELPLGIPQAWWADLADYEPHVVAAGLGRKLLLLFGEKDYQCTLADAAIWRSALDGGAIARFITYPGLFHLFMKSSDRGPGDYEVPGSVDGRVVRDIADWVKGDADEPLNPGPGK